MKNDLARYRAAGADPRGLPEQMISILKDRVDPRGLRSLEWRPLGNNRIEVRMPAGSDEAQRAKHAYITALEQLEQDNISRPQLRRALELSGTGPNGGAVGLGPAGTQALQAVCWTSWPTPTTPCSRPRPPSAPPAPANRAKAAAALDEAVVAYESKLLDLEATNVSPQRVQSVLSYYVSSAEAEAIGNAAEVAAGRQQFETDLKALLERHPARAGEIQDVVDKYKAYAQGRQTAGRPRRPEAPDRQGRRAGVPHRPVRPGLGRGAGDACRIGARPLRGDARQGRPRGREAAERTVPVVPPARSAGEGQRGWSWPTTPASSYVLLSNQPGEVMLQGTGATAWSLKDAFPDTDQHMRPAVGFTFDPRGAKRFGDLTANHLRQAPGRPAGRRGVFVPRDPEQSSPPRGIIEGRLQDRGGAGPGPHPAGRLAAGPAQPRPGGGEHLRSQHRRGEPRAGPARGYYSLIVVVAFMAGYYLLAGMVANLAMVLNVLLVLGAMSLLNAVFTLPGIAGVILTIGMAVDANVLIYERLREEQAKGLSIRMAIKNAYERAFSAIFDSNITTLIAAVILGWVGTEEVRGFAITLGLGVTFNLFTAVFVTRWVFQAMLDGRAGEGPLLAC